MSSWHNVFSFVISTISLLGAMVGLIVASTISPHNPHSLHGGLKWPHRQMSGNAALTARYTSDIDTREFPDSPKALSRRHHAANLSLLDRQHPASPQMPTRHSSGEWQEQRGQTKQDDNFLTRWLSIFHRGQSRRLNNPGGFPQPSVPPLHDDSQHQCSTGHHQQMRAVQAHASIRWLTNNVDMTVMIEPPDSSHCARMRNAQLACVLLRHNTCSR